MESLLFTRSKPTVSWGDEQTGYVISSWKDFHGTQYVKVTTCEGIVTTILASDVRFLAGPTVPLRDHPPDFAFVSSDGQQMSAFNCLAANQPGETILVYERWSNGVRSFNVKDLLLSGCKVVPWALWTAQQAELKRAEAAAILAERRAALRSLPTEEDEDARSAQRDAKVLARELLAAKATRLAEQEQALAAKATRLAEQELALAAEEARLAEQEQPLVADATRLAEQGQEQLLAAEEARTEAETARLAERAQPVAARLAEEVGNDTFMAQELGLISPLRETSLVQTAPLAEEAFLTATTVFASSALVADLVPRETPVRARRVTSWVQLEPETTFAAPNLGISIAHYSAAALRISAWSEDEFDANWNLFWSGLGVEASYVGPVLRRKNMQLWLCLQAVCSAGGFESVILKGKWKSVAVAQNAALRGAHNSVSSSVKIRYEAVGLFAFERHHVALLCGINSPYTEDSILTKGLLSKRVIYKQRRHKLVKTADTPASSSEAAAALDEAAEAPAVPSLSGMATLLDELHPSTSLFPLFTPGVPAFPLAATSEIGDLDYSLDFLDSM